MKGIVLPAVLAAAAIAVTAGAGYAAPNYHVVNKYAVGGDGFWDYLSVDPGTGHLFISRGSHVQVMDTSTGKIVGDIDGTTGVHGLAVDGELNRGFTSNGCVACVSVVVLFLFLVFLWFFVGLG